MPELRIPIYRPEITVYERTAKNRDWAVDGRVSKQGTITNTLFYPIADGTTITDVGFKRVVEHGQEVFCTILAPDGSELGHAGTAMVLKAPDGKAHDAINALVYAKGGVFGLELLSARPRPAPAPPPIPTRASGPAMQLSMF